MLVSITGLSLISNVKPASSASVKQPLNEAVLLRVYLRVSADGLKLMEVESRDLTRTQRLAVYLFNAGRRIH